MTITITDLTPADEEEAARLLARAFVTNPRNAAVFCEHQINMNEAFFRIVLTMMKGPKFGFDVTGSAPIRGVVNYFMQRDASGIVGASRLIIYLERQNIRQPKRRRMHVKARQEFQTALWVLLAGFLLMPGHAMSQTVRMSIPS